MDVCRLHSWSSKVRFLSELKWHDSKDVFPPFSGCHTLANVKSQRCSFGPRGSWGRSRCRQSLAALSGLHANPAIALSSQKSGHWSVGAHTHAQPPGHSSQWEAILLSVSPSGRDPLQKPTSRALLYTHACTHRATFHQAIPWCHGLRAPGPAHPTARGGEGPLPLNSFSPRHPLSGEPGPTPTPVSWGLGAPRAKPQ